MVPESKNKKTTSGSHIIIVTICGKPQLTSGRWTGKRAGIQNFFRDFQKKPNYFSKVSAKSSANVGRKSG